MSVDDEIPIPCRTCGAPMMEEASAGGQGAVTVRCEYCQRSEALPADHGERVTMLRARLAETAAARQALEAPALAIANLAEVYPRQFARTALPMLAILGVFSLMTVMQALNMPESAGLAMLLAAARMPLTLFIMLGSVVGITTYGLRRYAAEIRPGLEARPAQQPNHYRCRGCGASIEAGSQHGAFVACSYCHAQNLLGASSAAHRAVQLEREVEEYRARARGQQPVIARAAERYRSRMSIVIGVMVAVNVGSAFAMSAVQTHLAAAP